MNSRHYRSLVALLATFVATISFAQKDDETYIPFDLRTMRPVLEVTINGKGPYKFVLDTGASQSMISFDLAQDLELPEIGRVSVSAPNSPNSIESPVFSIRELQVGEIKFFKLKAASILDREFMKILKADGILSAQDFRGFLVTLDYRKRRMVLKTGQLPEADEQTVFEYYKRNLIPGLMLDVDGKKTFFHLDTGSPLSIALPGTLLTKLDYKQQPRMIGQAGTVTGTFLIYWAQMAGDIKIGKYTIEKPGVQIMGDMPYGNLGYRFFRDYLITFDYFGNKVRLVHWKEALDERDGTSGGVQPTANAGSR